MSVASILPRKRFFAKFLSSLLICPILVSLSNSSPAYSGFSVLPRVQADEPLNSILKKPAFILFGTITSNNGQRLALIKTQNKKLKFYTPGEKIGIFTLESIQRNKIRVRHSNQQYILQLQQKISRPQQTPALATQPENAISINRALLNHIRNNTQRWLNSIVLQLDITEGMVSGYIVESVKNIPFNSNIGLKQGDIIRAINGIPVGQSELFAKMVNNLLNSSDIYIEIERAHRIQIINFNISD